MKTERPSWANKLPVDRMDCIVVLVALASLAVDSINAILGGVVVAMEVYLGEVEMGWGNIRATAVAVVAPVVIWLAVGVFRRVLRLYRVAP